MTRKTPLHAIHINSGAKMGAFAGYDMPLFYKDGVMKEHEWVRGHAGVFDVSHMGQITIEGAGVAEFLETITPSAFQPKKPGRAQYTVLTNEAGGIIDDLIITRMSENKFFAVINAGCKDKDIAWIKQNLPSGLALNYMEDQGLIAIQGPSAEGVLGGVLGQDLSDMPYMYMIETKAPCGAPIFVSRVGYTGEDGFEISVPAEKTEAFWNLLSEYEEVKPIGLAARDSLRLEMGYALYGHDIDGETSPVEADIAWIISKKTQGYFGYERIRGELDNGPARKRVGIKLTDKGVAREGAEILGKDGSVIGVLTSGGFSPTLGQAVGQGYVEASHADLGNDVFVSVRGRKIAAKIEAMPFVTAKTKSMKPRKAA